MQKPKYKILTDALLPELETKMNEAAKDGFSLKGEIQRQNTIYLAVMQSDELVEVLKSKLTPMLDKMEQILFPEGYRHDNSAN